MKYLIVALVLSGCTAAPMAQSPTPAPSLSDMAPERIPCDLMIEAWDQNVQTLAAARTAANLPMFIGTVLRGRETVLRDRRDRLEKRKRECGL